MVLSCVVSQIPENIVRNRSPRCARSQSRDKRVDGWTCAILLANSKRSEQIVLAPSHTSICIVIVINVWSHRGAASTQDTAYRGMRAERTTTADTRNTQNLVFVKREIMRRSKLRLQRTTTTTNHLRLENTFIKGTHTNTHSPMPYMLMLAAVHRSFRVWHERQRAKRHGATESARMSSFRVSRNISSGLAACIVLNWSPFVR